MENLSLLMALWLGVMTSISPCPLATNIAAVSYISKHVKSSRLVLISGLVYSIGRSITYMVITAVLAYGAASSHVISMFLQKYMNKVLGPVLIVTGMFLLEIVRLKLPSMIDGQKYGNLIKKHGILGSAFIGILFALSFCPVSAALYFGGVVPFALKSRSVLGLPLFYGIGTALPVILFAMLISFSVKYVSIIYNKISMVEKWIRMATGTIFILVGIYYCLAYVFEIF